MSNEKREISVSNGTNINAGVAPKNDSLSAQANVCLLKEGHFLGKDILPLLRTSKRFYGFFKKPAHSNLILVAALLLYVTKGKQSQARQMPSPMLLLEKADVTDFPAGRHFKQITAYQYALWAGDKRMVRMIEEIACNTRGLEGKILREALLEQWQELRDKGISYTLDGREYREIAYNPKLLFEAYRNYILKHDGLLIKKAWGALKTLWSCGVGVQQKLMPAHAFQELGNQKSFYNPAAFGEAILRRTFNIYNPETGTIVFELSALISKTSGLGISFAIIRSERQSCAIEAYVKPKEARFDWDALTNLFKACEAALRSKPVLEEKLTEIFPCVIS